MKTQEACLIEEARKRAHKELENERLEKLVAQEKARIRARQEMPWYHRVFPFRITITRR